MGYGGMSMGGNQRAKRGVGRYVSCNSDLVDCFFNNMVGVYGSKKDDAPRLGGAQNGRGSFWFEGRAVYSYDTCVARYSESNVLLVREKDFSHTTAVHMRHLMGEARRRGVEVMRVPEVWARSDAMHVNNLSWLVAQYNEKMHTLVGAKFPRDYLCVPSLGYDRRDITPKRVTAPLIWRGKEVGGYWYDSRETNGIEVYVQSELRTLWYKAWDYRKVFRVDYPMPDYEADVEAVMTKRRAIERAYMHPTKVAHRELTKQRRLFMNIV